MNRTKICEVCGKRFEKPSTYTHAQWAGKRFCSNACASRERHDAYLGRNLKGKKSLTELHAELTQAFEDAGVPYGECCCGCGGKTKIARQSSSRDLEVNGQPRRYLKGHAGRQLTQKDRLLTDPVARRTRRIVTGGR